MRGGGEKMDKHTVMNVLVGEGVEKDVN